MRENTGHMLFLGSQMIIRLLAIAPLLYQIHSVTYCFVHAQYLSVRLPVGSFLLSRHGLIACLLL